MNLQRVFNKIAKHLLTQNEKSEAGWACRYRLTVPGKVLKCAIGCLISDDLYKKEIEGSVPSQENVRSVLSESGFKYDFLSDEEKFLSKMQWVHDCNTPEDWKAALTRVARE